jgi:hypothetical protein
MQNRKLSYVLFALAAAGAGTGCTINGRSLLPLGAQPPSAFPPGNGGPTAGPGNGGPSPATPLASAPAPVSYAWCKDVREDGSPDDVKEALDPAGEPGRAIPALLQTLCHPRDSAPGPRAALEAARRTWMQRLLTDERDWATDIVPWANLPYGDRMAMLRHTVEPQLDAPWSSAGPLEQWALLRARTGPSDAFPLQPGASYYIADALPLTESGRLAFLERCLFVRGADDAPVEWATCQPDLDALDLGKLAPELRAEPARPLADRIALRLSASAVLRHLPAHAARTKQLIAKDPAYAALFDLARAAHQEWTTRAASRADLLAAVRAMDDARATGSRRALEGCSARTWPLFAAAVGKLPASRFENLRADTSRGGTFLDAAIGAILQDPDAYLAANALLACEGPADHLLRSLRDGLSYWPGFRGPRTATLTAIRLANLTPDKRGETIDVPSVRLPLAIDPHRRPPAARLRRSATGIIATVTDRGDTVRVTFPAASELQDQCATRRTTSRLSRIDASGNLHYESVCTQWQRLRVDTTPAPIDVPRRYAAGLAPRRHVSIVGGIPEAIWPRATSPTPLAAFGALLK